MKINVGDTVAFSRSDAAISGHAAAALGFDFINSLRFNKCKFYKGVVTKVKTHSFFFFRLETPVYLIDDYYVVKNVKLIKRKYASLRKEYSSGSVWEMHIT